MTEKKIKNALISVYHKDNIDDIVAKLDRLGITIYSTGGTFDYIRDKGFEVLSVEELTGYPSILGGRVKTLHPKVFGGILATSSIGHQSELSKFEIPAFDLVIVDLYPFEDTVKNTNDESEIIEKIDIGGISLIRAAAKNFSETLVIPSIKFYAELLKILDRNNGITQISDRKEMAIAAFNISSSYDRAISDYFSGNSFQSVNSLRYGENPHQSAEFIGNLSEIFKSLGGKELSYNNLVDIDAAVNIMYEFRNDIPTVAILKHTNPCGLASRENALEAWNSALECDPVSAFGGIIITNFEISELLAIEIDKIFYEVLIAPSFSDGAKELLSKKKKRILLELKKYPNVERISKSLLNGKITQDSDIKTEDMNDLTVVTKLEPNQSEINDLLFANKCAKHLKSNTIVLAKNQQMIGMGCGQTSRVDACKQAIAKAKAMGFELNGAVMASDAFFPFPDCVELAYEQEILAVIQPGGSMNDQLSIDYCDSHGMSMVFTSIRHFKH